MKLFRVVSILFAFFVVALALEVALADADSTEVPFEVTFNLTIVKVRVNGKDCKMVFDTGASVTVILPDAAKRLGLKAGSGVGAGAGLGTMGRSTVIDRLQIGEIEVKKLSAFIMQVPQIAAVRGFLKVDGIIGYTFAKNFVITLDYPNKRLTISRPGAAPRTGSPETVSPLTRERQEYRGKARELAESHVEMARWCAEKGLEKEAKARYQAALELDPANEEARKALGRRKAPGVEPRTKAQKEPPKAEEKPRPRPVEKKRPEMSGVERSRLHSQVVEKLQNKEYDEAEDLLLKILKSYPKDHLAFYNLACVYSLQNKKEKAIKYLGRAIDAGYTNYRHIEKDTDLENIRGEEGYKKLLKDLIRGSAD